MSFTWWAIGILIVVLLIAIFKTQDLVFIFSLIKKYGFIIVIVGLVLFISFSLYRISMNHNVNFTSFDGLVKGGKLYFAWLKSIFANVGKITGYAIEQDWVLNSTNMTK